MSRPTSEGPVMVARDDSASARIPIGAEERSIEETKPVDLDSLDLPASEEELDDELRALAQRQARVAFRTAALAAPACGLLALVTVQRQLPYALGALGAVCLTSIALTLRPIAAPRVVSVLVPFGALASGTLGLLAGFSGGPSSPWLALHLSIFGYGALAFAFTPLRLAIAELCGGAFYLTLAASLAPEAHGRSIGAAALTLLLGGIGSISVCATARRQAKLDYETRRKLDRARDKLTARNRDLKARVQSEVQRSLGALELTRYVPREVAERLLRGAAPELKRERRRLTVCSVRIASFSALADALVPEDTGRLIQRYIEEMSEAVDDYGGAIDRVAGDALGVLFGAPEPRPDADGAEACVDMALELLSRAARLVRTCEQLGTEVPFGIQIGIATGYCTVGTFGSLERMQYTAIGAAVDLASSLCAGAKTAQILISHATAGLLRDRFELVELGELTPPGHARQVHAYGVVGRKGAKVGLVG